MTREIKFRAWDEQNKIIHNDVEFIRSGAEGNDWIIFKSDKQKLEDKKVLDNPYFAQQIKLMQFTGLLDKNGKEIYEGDILFREVEIMKGDRVKEWAEVLYQAPSFTARIDKRKHTNLITSLLTVRTPFYIIGNICENPELLTCDEQS